jgi:transcriptional regulator GlxA family with amidase domain
MTKLERSLTLLALSFASALPVGATGTATPPAYTRNVAVVVYDGMEILDFGGPAEVFAAAAGFGAQGGEPAYRVYTVGKTRDAVVSQGFIDIVPDHSIADAPKPDILVLPGGSSNAVSGDPDFHAWIVAAGGDAEAVVTVCTGAFIAARAGLLDGLDATTYYGALANFEQSFPKVKVQPGRRFVDNGKVVTTAGVSAGIDGSLHFVARDLGRWVADRTAEYMEYRWSPESSHAAAYPQLNPRLDARGRELQLATLAMRAGDVSSAMATWRRLLGSAPGDAAVWLDAGNQLAGRKRWPEAAEAYTQAAKGEKESGRANYNLACVLALSGDRRGALAAAERAAESGFGTRSLYLEDGDLASIRDDPRFAKLLERLPS